MASSKGILRSAFVMVLILGAGFFGLWLLGGNKISVTNQTTTPSDAQTPQETLSLLIKALEKNDLTAAVEYFIPENQAVESEALTKLYDANILGELIKDLKSVKNGKSIDARHYRFEVLDSSGQNIADIDLVKNENGIWKIVSL
ncbi:MAG: hypothetical protein Q7S78_00740 [Candidatus Azambacteria bacterium]|nr:hypothetical protein [Candidatus Azambacteria bacterium]